MTLNMTRIFAPVCARPVGSSGVAHMVWGYLKSELQALPLEPDHNYSIGRKLDSDLVLKVRRSPS